MWINQRSLMLFRSFFLDLRKQLGVGPRRNLRGTEGMTSSGISVKEREHLKKCPCSKLSIFEHLQLCLIAWSHSGEACDDKTHWQWPSVGRDVQIPEGFCKNNKSGCFSRAELSDRLRCGSSRISLSCITLLVLLKWPQSFSAGGRLIRPSVTISGTKWPHAWHSDADLLFPVSNAKHMSSWMLHSHRVSWFNDVINFLHIRGKSRRQRDCLEVLTFFFAVPGSAVKELTVILGNPKNVEMFGEFYCGKQQSRFYCFLNNILYC